MKILEKIKVYKYPFLQFAPFLVLYILYIVINASPESFGDEPRYLSYANHLIHGYYSPQYPYIDLGNGPGYPLILTPFVALNLPVIYAKLLNGVCYYLSVVFLYKALREIVSLRFAFIFSVLWAVYPNTFEQMYRALPEVFASTLIPPFIFCIIKAFKADNFKKAQNYLISAGVLFGYLVLTKPVFGYVLSLILIVALILWFVSKKKLNNKKLSIILIISFLTTVPYLIYTYNLTGKMFYWSSFGGNNLYWMSTPYEGEYGNYYHFPFASSQDRIPGSEKIIKLHHQKDFEELLKNSEVRKANIINGEIQQDLSNGIAQDDLLKKIAIENIKSHPLKFLQNCFSNVGRMLFNYPASYVLQKPSTLLRLPFNGILLVFVLFSLIPTFINWKKVFYSLRFLLIFAIVYFGGSLLGSAGPRMFTVIVPILLIWIAYVLQRTVKIKLNFDERGHT
jgi:4-amino-4-deoxy-L-arabinose transferase-like glycosyltransferase